MNDMNVRTKQAWALADGDRFRHGRKIVTVVRNEESGDGRRTIVGRTGIDEDVVLVVSSLSKMRLA